MSNDDAVKAIEVLQSTLTMRGRSGSRDGFITIDAGGASSPHPWAVFYRRTRTHGTLSGSGESLPIAVEELLGKIKADATLPDHVRSRADNLLVATGPPAFQQLGGPGA